MYYLLSLLTGSVISVMIFLNGKLTISYGPYLASVIIHIVGVAFAGTICLFKKAKLRNRAPLWAYLGGVIGVLSTLFNNYAFGRIGMTSIVALGLLGQSLTSVALDNFGWLGMKKRALGKYAFIGYLTALIGIFVMLEKSASGAILAATLSFSAGITVVLSRSVNSRLSTETSPLVGSLINHIVGLPICVVLALLIQPSPTISIADTNPLMYLGGVFGVLTVLLFNMTVPKVPAFRLTLLSFVGQIFFGVLLDIAFGSSFSPATFAGAVIIAVGLLANMLIEQRDQKKCNP